VALLALGSVVLASYDIRQVAGPLMREFALENNVSISLAMRDGTDMVYLETYRSQSRVSVQLTVGSRADCHHRHWPAFYAGLPDNVRQQLDGELATRYGERWPELQQRLQQAMEEYQRCGYSASFGEYEPDVMAVGVHLPSPTPASRR
jgi:DNA-binding IclR family transcriptional regulator